MSAPLPPVHCISGAVYVREIRNREEIYHYTQEKSCLRKMLLDLRKLRKGNYKTTWV